MNTHNKGFGLITIIIAIAVVLAVSGGGYYAVKHAKKSISSQTEVYGDSAATSSVATQGSSGVLRDLFSMTKNVMCTINDATTTGTVYISSDKKMRGDFTIKTQTSGSIDSHMIKDGNDIYAWSAMMGTGAKFSFDVIDTNASVKKNVNLDQKINYTCVDWKQDTSKFVKPADIKFIDVSGVVNANGSVNSSAATNGCAACAQLPAGAAQTQCRQALKCPVR